MNIEQLQQRYGLKRRALYGRLNALDIVLDKDSGAVEASDDQVKLLDEQHEHIKRGGSLQTFTPLMPVRHEDSSHFNDIAQIVNAIATLKSHHDPTWYMGRLECARVGGWILTTKEVKQLIGVRPTGTKFIRGCFVFVWAGRIGRSSGWKVLKVNGGLPPE